LELNTIYNMDCIEGLKKIPANSIDACITSPPYWNLRDYDVEGQIGYGDSYEEYVKKMVDVFTEVHRVLKDDGTMWLNLGDGYAGTHQTRKKSVVTSGRESKWIKEDNRPMSKGFDTKPKDLLGIPWRVAFALQSSGWYLRNDIIWHKPNAAPEPSVKDRFIKSHEYIFMFSKSAKYYFDFDSIRENNGKGMGKKDVWTINIKHTKNSHYATFPEELIDTCVIAGCPDNGTILDPFMGSGTTAIVSLKNNRNFIGFELNDDFVNISNDRIEKV
jgi:site-specific DNA-methyltransferase (cytosine-N4-specific)